MQSDVAVFSIFSDLFTSKLLKRKICSILYSSMTASDAIVVPVPLGHT